MKRHAKVHKNAGKSTIPAMQILSKDIVISFLGGGSPQIVCTIVGGSAKIVLIRTRGEGGQKTRFLPVRTIWMVPYIRSHKILY